MLSTCVERCPRKFLTAGLAAPVPPGLHLVPTLESKRGHGTSSGTNGGAAQSNTRQCQLPPVAAVVVVVPLFTVGLVCCGGAEFETATALLSSPLESQAVALCTSHQSHLLACLVSLSSFNPASDNI